MANFDKYFPNLLDFEGGYVNDPKDKGGATKFGVTLSVWIKNGWDKDMDGDIDKYDIQNLSKDDAKYIAKKLYWDKIKGDEINSQSLAELLFDFAYLSGVGTATKKLQHVLGLKQDGVLGPKTLELINAAHPKAVFELLKIEREKFFLAIVANNPSQAKFLKGWKNRNNKFTFHD